MAKFYDSRGGQVPAERVAEWYPGTSIYMRTVEETSHDDAGTPTTRTAKIEAVVQFSDDEQFTERAFGERLHAQRLPQR